MKNYCKKLCLAPSAGMLALLLAGTALAQDAKPATRQAKVKIFQNINGVETIRDTVITIPMEMAIPDLKELTKFRTDIKIPEGEQKQIIMINPDGRVTENPTFRQELPKDIEIALKEHKEFKVIKLNQDFQKLSEDSTLKNKVFIYHSGENLRELENIKLEIDGLEKINLNEIAKANLNTTSNIRILNAKGDSLILVKSVVLLIKDLTLDEKQLLHETAQREINSKKIKDLALEELSLYPNPTTGQFKLSFEAPRKGNTLITVLDAAGREVYREELSSFKGRYEKELDLSKEPKGMYYLQIIQGKQVANKKIVLQ